MKMDEDDARELIRKWRIHVHYGYKENYDWAEGVEVGYQQAADDLEELLNSCTPGANPV
jgi:hypothetical protein